MADPASEIAEIERNLREAHNIWRLSGYPEGSGGTLFKQAADALSASAAEVEWLREALVLAEDALRCGNLNQIQEEALAQVRVVLRGQLEQNNER